MATQAPAKQETRSVVDIVKDKVNQFIKSGELLIPQNYSPDNAMKAAWLVLQDIEDKDHHKALDVCTKQSVANALLDMVVQGLNPLKNQGYFIVYGKSLNFQRSYFGSMAVAQLVNPEIDEFAYAVVYEGDKFKYGIKNGKKTVQEHEQDIENVKKEKIVAAYAIALDRKGEPLRTEIMTFDEIKQAWAQSKMKPINEKGEVNAGSTHGKFTGPMALKTVANRLCKAIINASSDNALLLNTMKKSEELADEAVVSSEFAELANTGPALEIREETAGTEPANGTPPVEEKPEQAAAPY